MGRGGHPHARGKGKVGAGLSLEQFASAKSSTYDKRAVIAAARQDKLNQLHRLKKIKKRMGVPVRAGELAVRDNVASLEEDLGLRPGPVPGAAAAQRDGQATATTSAPAPEGGPGARKHPKGSKGQGPAAGGGSPALAPWQQQQPAAPQLQADQQPRVQEGKRKRAHEQAGAEGQQAPGPQGSRAQQRGASEGGGGTAGGALEAVGHQLPIHAAPVPAHLQPRGPRASAHPGQPHQQQGTARGGRTQDTAQKAAGTQQAGDAVVGATARSQQPSGSAEGAGGDGGAARPHKCERRGRPPSSLQRLAGRVQEQLAHQTAEQEQAERERAERQARLEAQQKERKQSKAKFFKKTSKGQPLMKFRLEKILDKLGAGL